MTKPNADLQTRLKELEDGIKNHRSKLELHGLFAREHHVTEKELRDRWSELQTEVDMQMHDENVLHNSADGLQRAVAKWVDAVDLDYK